MAYMNKERKAARMPAIKAVLKKYNMKGTVRVRHYSTLVVTLRSGALDLIAFANKHNAEAARTRGWGDAHVITNGRCSINEYYDADNARNLGEEEIGAFIDELTTAMYGDDYYNHNDPMTDYFNCSHYIDINVGEFEKPYVLTA